MFMTCSMDLPCLLALRLSFIAAAFIWEEARLFTRITIFRQTTVAELQVAFHVRELRTHALLLWGRR